MKAVLILVIIIAGCSASERLDIEVYFCPEANCLQLVSGMVKNATEAVCALYSYDEELFRNAIVVTEDNRSGLMHNKFCVLDGERVITGSFNPHNRAAKDRNNVVVIDSRKVAEAFQREFQELQRQDKKPGKTIVTANGSVEILFCPEDHCADRIEEELLTAEKEILFAAFVFTHPSMATVLIMKKMEGVAVHGVVDGSYAATNYSQVSRLMDNNVDVFLDTAPGRMHHKFFVIDNKTVITGSMNPTQGGDQRNDENVVVFSKFLISQDYRSWKEYNYPRN